MLTSPLNLNESESKSESFHESETPAQSTFLGVAFALNVVCEVEC